MLQPVIVRAPGFGGLNLEGEEITNSAQYARVAENLVFDNAGRLASRKGYLNVNDLSGSDNVDAIFIYDKAGGTATVISATADHIYATTTDKQGSLAHTTAHWQFTNFNDLVVGAQQGLSLISYDGGAGNFAAITPNGGGTVPTGNCLHAAFGRLWTCDANATLLYCSALLDETTWQTSTTTTDSYEWNILSNEAAVRDGYDEIVAINHLDDKLVVFLKNSIVIFDKPEDPANMGIYKTIANIGCIARDSVQQVGNDLVFLSRDGLRGLMRAIMEDNFPLRDLSQQVRTDLVAAVSGSPDAVKSAYYPDEGIYVLLFTGADAWVFDFKRIAEDGLPRVTTWNVPTWHSLYYHDGTLYIGQEGEYGKYSGYAEDGAVYAIEYQSLNVDFDNPNIKSIKETRAAFTGAADQRVVFSYVWDYGTHKTTTAAALPSNVGTGIYNTDNYGTAIYGDGISRGTLRVQPFGDGYLLSFGFSAFVKAIKLTIEQISHFVKLGRIGR